MVAINGGGRLHHPLSVVSCDQKLSVTILYLYYAFVLLHHTMTTTLYIYVDV